MIRATDDVEKVRLFIIQAWCWLRRRSSCLSRPWSSCS
jgi:hypothetical protein